MMRRPIMTTATTRRALRLLLATASAALLASPAHALVLDDRGEMRLGLRAYTAVRLGTEEMGSSDNPLTWPHSGTGHVRQNRYFLELKLDHDIKRLATTGYGAAALFGWLDPSKLSYSLQYRGEGEGIYDYGPSEFSDQGDKLREFRTPSPELKIPGIVSLSPKLPAKYIDQRVAHLRNIARQRHRFFIGYLDFEKGPLFVRIGRQVLAWGETDIFRLLDNINPLDDSFGGFFIALDERRVPLDMLRMSYHIGSIGPLSDTFIEAFGAEGNRVATSPGIPPGSPWEPGGLGTPNPALRTVADVPDRDAFRGGARLVFNVKDVTATLAHYYTYLDIPGVKFNIPGQKQLPGEISATNTPRFGNEIVAVQRFPRVPITGAAVTFPISSLYSVVRSEAAYFQDEPMNRQGTGNAGDSGCPTAAVCAAKNRQAGFQRLKNANNTEGGLDPFIYPRFFDLGRKNPIHGSVLQRDTFNVAVGLDVNRFIHWLNPQQTFFFTTQFFYKHVFDSPGDLVLPVPYRNLPVPDTVPFVGTPPGCNGKPCRLRPRLFHLDDDRFLQTLLITTAYSGGRIVPFYGMFYDWQGTWVVQPGVTLVRDPFRFTTDYTRVSGPPTGAFGAVRDRDNVRFQIEFVF
jgi:uncharacterized protein DUF1302